MMRRFGSIFLFFLLASTSALAQLSAEAKGDVLREIDRVLSERAFVPGVDLRRWPEFLERRRESVDRAETPDAFVRIVNSALRDFGISHISLRRPASPPRLLVPELWALQGSRRQVQAPPSPDTIEWLDDESVLLRIRSFNESYQPRHIDGLFREAANAKHMVLDLRSNGGGRVDHMSHLLGFFLPNNAAVGTFVSRRAALDFIAAGLGDGSDPLAIAQWYDRKYRIRSSRVAPFRGKVAVLVNRGSASASEITASALRENIDSPIVGTRTAGAVLVSTFQRLPHGFQIQYPVSDYVSIQGLRLEGNPLTPDIELTLNQSRTDAAVAAARQALDR
jgi:hypothetical protein